MNLRDSDFSRTDLAFVRDLYETAFPPEERLPFRVWLKPASRGKARILLFEEKGERAGFAYLICSRDLAYLVWFAIREDLRGRGVGGAALDAMLRENRDKRFLLALEDWREDCENREERLRRHAFYLRHGLEDQPIRLKEAKMVYASMTRGGTVRPEEFKAMMDPFLGFFYRRWVDTRLLEQEEKK